MDQLRQQNKALAPMFGSVGTAAGLDVGKAAQASSAVDDASTKLEELTKAHMEKHPGITEAQAEAAVLETAEGGALYDQIAKAGTHTVAADIAA